MDQSRDASSLHYQRLESANALLIDSVSPRIPHLHLQLVFCAWQINVPEVLGLQ